MQRNPDATYLDGRQGQRKWNYTTGLELKSFLDAAKRYDLPEVVDYVRSWADTMATGKGEIYSYKKSNYNVIFMEKTYACNEEKNWYTKCRNYILGGNPYG